jgi:hypothetical protein
MMILDSGKIANLNSISRNVLYYDYCLAGGGELLVVGVGNICFKFFLSA